MPRFLSTIGITVLAYLLGAIPFAFLITRWRTGLDIRWVGEGNVGARNVWHVVGPRWGTVAALLDLAKGTAAAQVALWWAGSIWALRAVGIALVLGHGFPIFLRGRGGKGAGPAIGFLMRLYPVPVLLGGAIFGLTRPLVTDWNLAAGFGLGAVPILSLLWGVSLADVTYMVFFLALLGLKKIMDLPHERRIRAERGWEQFEGRSGR
jgi:glycerol-3-phosphate acyltransferase PlsY